jgi:hypothetical protein
MDIYDFPIPTNEKDLKRATNIYSLLFAIVKWWGLPLVALALRKKGGEEKCPQEVDRWLKNTAAGHRPSRGDRHFFTPSTSTTQRVTNMIK